jgi:hypothetical protein
MRWRKVLHKEYAADVIEELPWAVTTDTDTDTPALRAVQAS